MTDKPSAGEAHTTNNDRHRTLWWSGAVFAFALIIRLAYLVDVSDSPSFGVPMVDAQDYDERARFLAETGRVPAHFFYQAWFYPSFLALIYKLCGGAVVTAQVVQALLGATTCVLTFWLARELFGQAAGVLAGAIVATYAPLLYFEAELLATGWAAFFSTALVLLFLLARKIGSLSWCLLLGLVGGLAILTRPSFLPFFFAGCAWLVVTMARSRLERKTFVRKTAALVAGFCLVAIPAATLAKRYVGSFSLVPFSGGLNLYIGNNPGTNDTINARPGWQWLRLVSMPNREGVHGPLAEQHFFTQKVKNYALEQPASFLSGMVQKTTRYISSRELPRNTDMYVLRRWSGLLRVLVWKVGGFGFPFGVLLPLAILGIVLHAGRCPWIVYLFLMLKPLSIILVFVAARYRVPAVPIFAVMAAGGCTALPAFLRDRRISRVTLAMFCALAIVPFSMLPGPFPEEDQINYEAELYGAVGIHHREQGNQQRAFEYFTMASEVQPGYSDILNELGRHWFMRADEAKTRGDQQAWRAHLSRAGELYHRARNAAPENPVSYIHLALLCENQENFDEALTHLRDGLRFDPKEPQLHYRMGVLLLARSERSVPDSLHKRNELKLAQEHFSRSIELSPSLGKAHFGLARALQRNGEVGQAIIHYEEALRLGPRSVALLRELAWLLATDADEKHRDGERAISLARRACHGPEPVNALFLDTLAAAYAEAGQFTLAVQFSQRAIEQAQTANGHERLTALEGRRQLYLSHQPYRDRRMQTGEGVRSAK
jgi:tetratricopeptide (TPR) repeat protein